MSFLNFLNRPVVLHCYTDRADIFNYAPIGRASKFIPDWWKALPKSVGFNTASKEPFDNSIENTMKGCVGFTNLYKTGFIIPMWCDFALEIGKINSGQYKYRFSDNTSVASMHPQDQRGAIYPEENYQHIKIHSPWKFVCEEEIDFLTVEPTWSISTPDSIKILPGVINFKYQYGTNINTIWTRRDEDIRYVLEYNQPLVHVIPLTDKKVVLKLHLLNTEDFANMCSSARPIKFANKFRTVKKTMDAKGCPFHYKTEK